MNTGEGSFALSAVSMAVRGALLAMCALPLAARAADSGDTDVKTLTNPTNSVEVGAVGVSNSTSKFGEYNGLNKSTGKLIGNVDVRGGNGYGGGDGTLRWDVNGTDLGTTSRSAGASVGSQGQWNIGINFDQLRHYTTGGTYQTPFQGNQGDNTFTLPNAFGVINSTAPGTNGITANQRSFFNTQDLYTERKNTSFTAGYFFSPQWSFKFDYNHLDQTGAKLIGTSTDTLNALGTVAVGGTGFAKEIISILPMPTNYKTDTVRATVNWVGEKAHLSGNYYGSYFRDAYSGFSWSDPYSTTLGATGTVIGGGAAFPLNTMSTPPNNDFHQFNLSGGYALSPATRLAGGLSYGRNTQNQSFAGTFTSGAMTALPRTSADALVVTTNANLKLTNQWSKNLNLSAAFNYNERDNRTAASSYTWIDIGGTSETAVNVPMSNKRTQLSLAGDYRFTPNQRLRAAYDYEQINRWCNDALANNARSASNPTGGTAATYYNQNGGSCAQVPKSADNRLSFTYRAKASDSVDLNAGYIYSNRNSTVNAAFYSPLQANGQGYENFGFRAFFQGSRKEDQLKGGANWQATEQLSFGVTGRYSKDIYNDAFLGVRTGSANSLNLDGTYAFSENNTVSAYVTQQNRKLDQQLGAGRNAIALILTQWTNRLDDQDTTIGLNAKQKSLFGGKFSLLEDMSFSSSKSTYSSASVSLTAAQLAVGGVPTGAVGSAPDIKSNIAQLRIVGAYQIDKVSQVNLGYAYQRLRSNDYYYNAYQQGFTPTSVLATNQSAPNYAVNVLFASYKYSFQ